MFTGIVSEIGEVTKVSRRNGSLQLAVRAPRSARELSVGDSIAVNGVCLTATRRSRRDFNAQVVSETLARTSLGVLEHGDPVNLELPARLVDRLGGHLVQGHVDALGTVTKIEDEGSARRVWIAAPPRIERYLVEKGSVTVDGVSLTISALEEKGFEVALIPHTLKTTTLGRAQVGTEFNIEVDVIAKYVERLLPEGK